MTNLRERSSLWRACPRTGAFGANESGAHASDLELIEMVMPADFETIDD
ncbi:MAG: hypothetical protein WDZ63_11695 [Burkholderiales bacterium]